MDVLHLFCLNKIQYFPPHKTLQVVRFILLLARYFLQGDFDAVFRGGKLLLTRCEIWYTKIIIEVSLLITWQLQSCKSYFHRTLEKHKFTLYLYVCLQDRFRTISPSFPVRELLLWWPAKWTYNSPRCISNWKSVHWLHWGCHCEWDIH
jgi:hypothetical protein